MKKTIHNLRIGKRGKNILFSVVAGMILFSLNACISREKKTGEKILTNEEKWEKNIRSSYKNWERAEKREETVFSGGLDEDTPLQIETATSVMLPAPMQNSAARKKLPSAVHTVVKGETLWGIARKYYGTGVRWQEIREANTERLKKGTIINPGLVLVIPSVEEQEKTTPAVTEKKETPSSAGKVENTEKNMKKNDSRDSDTGKRK